ncbi:SAM-dependent methyltransferase [Marivivens niveibacter]|uniref:SAM-dependent methyltransferase n=1 Tax=Marivivens niveibacter TaxID=1930667 RepID=A0A251X2Y8_9RHOB|nr:cyclopropane-fatty-acyl-phospholipid synthase family protein [Marivivens niveibacter]OUD10941.1 SAM-dependent methyltransferase [Marivivens niveibacter]
MILTSTQGQHGLPRYFVPVFDILSRIERGRIDIILPDGRQFRAEGPNAGYVTELHVHNDDIFARLIREGDLGFMEAYMDEWWSTPDLMAFMDFVHDASDEVFDGFPGQALVRAYEKLRFWLQSNTKRQAKKNISYHYDLGNDFYGLWLDPSMTYSSALYSESQMSLEDAQTAKYKAMVDQMDVQPGDHVLEIGCGWGGFAEYAAKERGLHVTGLTISREQYDYATKRIADAGLSDRVTFKMQDYRDEKGQYDGIASIEMFEAVGEKYWPTYFATVKRCLRPGKNATLQIITVQDHRFELYRKGVDFIQKYIFPGGMLPSPKILRQQAKGAGMNVVGSIEFGESYSQTLRRWYDTFNEKWDEISQMGFDTRFRHMWNMYLTSCASTFHSGNCDVTQITVQRPA